MAMLNDPERELRAKLERLAGDDEKWLLVAAGVLDKAPKMTKDLIREADDDKARRRVQMLIELAGVTSGGQTGVGAGTAGGAVVQGLYLQLQDLRAKVHELEVAIQEQQVAIQEQQVTIQEQQVTIQEQQPLMSVLADMLDYSEGSASTATTLGFKQSLVAAYSPRSDRGTLFCMLTHVQLPSAIVIASHLWKRGWHRALKLMDIEDVNDVRNGLLLAKPLEWAFDAGYLSIVLDKTFTAPGTGGASFQAVLINPALKGVALFDKLREILKDSLTNEQLTDIDEKWTCNGVRLTFGDMHGRMLRSGKNGTAPNPYARLLEYQFRKSLKKGKDDGWEPEGPLPTCHGSPPWEDKIKTWFKSFGP